jgi:hypothetical protein
MNNDPLLVGVGSIFPTQNSSTAPTVWEEDTDQGAQQGIPSGSGPMLTLTKRSNNLAFLPSGAVNPAPEPNPQCLIVSNLRINPGAIQRLSAAQLGSGLIGTSSIAGVSAIGALPAAPGIGVLGVGAPGDGVRGLARGAIPAGHGVFGQTNSSNPTDAGVRGEANLGGVGVKGQSLRGSGIGVQGVGGVAGVQGGNRTTAGTRIGVHGISGPNFFSGPFTFIPFAGRFDGPVSILTSGGAPGDLTVDGSLFVFGPTKSSVVPHPDGSQRVMHTVEAPESWFEDIGRAQLRDGVAQVDVDPDFAAVSGLGDDYHVFLAAEGPSNALYVSSRTSTGFEVREQGEGTSEISFSYRIMTRRANARLGRLEPIERPSQEGVRATEPADMPTVPSAEPLPEGTVAEPPSDWPETVPWPPDIMRD